VKEFLLATAITALVLTGLYQVAYHYCTVRGNLTVTVMRADGERRTYPATRATRWNSTNVVITAPSGEVMDLNGLYQIDYVLPGQPK